MNEIRRSKYAVRRTEVVYMRYHGKEGTVAIGNTGIDYVCFGRGTKPLVIIPGLSFNRVKGFVLPLMYMYRMFARQYRVYVFDRKEVIPEGYAINDIARDTAYAMKTLGLSNAYVFGISQGGMIAQYLAAGYPELVDKLVLGVTLSRQNETVQKVVRNWISLCEKNDYRGIAADMLEKMYSDAYVKRYRRIFPLLARFGKPKDMNRFILLAEACLTCDIYKDLDKIQCPVFVIGGRQDKVVTGEASEEIAEKLGCSIYMYENLGHSAYEEAKDFNSRIDAFLHS